MAAQSTHSLIVGYLIWNHDLWTINDQITLINGSEARIGAV